MNAKEMIKQAQVPVNRSTLNFILGALTPVLGSSRQQTPAGELVTRALLAGGGGVAGSKLGEKAGLYGAGKLNRLSRALAMKGKGRLGRAAGTAAAYAPFLADIAGFLTGVSAGSSAGGKLYRASKRVATKKWGEGRPEGLLKRVSLPAASALEAAKSELK